MKVLFSVYTLTPLKRANRLSSLQPMKGVMLKAELNNKVFFADYFPHLPLGDRSCDQFLSEFKFQDHEYDKKVFDLMMRDSDFQKLVPKKIYNHQLWSGSDEIAAPIVKYKLLSQDDKSFLKVLEKGSKLRLDANGMFGRDEYVRFVKEIDPKFYPLIEYVEDPLKENDWNNLELPSAMDFIKGSNFKYYIYKPNCEFKPEIEEDIIYSSYLGGNLGRWHSYCELVLNGNLTLVHGIRTDGFNNEEIPFLQGSYEKGFSADMSLVNKIYKYVDGLNWKTLCSM